MDTGHALSDKGRLDDSTRKDPLHDRRSFLRFRPVRPSYGSSQAVLRCKSIASDYDAQTCYDEDCFAHSKAL